MLFPVVLGHRCRLLGMIFLVSPESRHGGACRYGSNRPFSIRVCQDCGLWQEGYNDSVTGRCRRDWRLSSQCIEFCTTIGNTIVLAVMTR